MGEREEEVLRLVARTDVLQPTDKKAAREESKAQRNETIRCNLKRLETAYRQAREERKKQSLPWSKKIEKLEKKCEEIGSQIRTIENECKQGTREAIQKEADALNLWNEAQRVATRYIPDAYENRTSEAEKELFKKCP
jgi:predicted phage tail protein